jgi:hypothetical protein
MINFFTNPWASSQTRGYQIAERINGTVVPVVVTDDSVNICIKCLPADGFLDKHKVYIDVVDGYGLIPWLKAHPTIGVIAISNVAKVYLEQQLGRKDIVLIPEQHCNFECYRKPLPEKPKVLGYIGYKENLHLDVDCIRRAIEPLGMTFETCFEFPTRESVCEFYKRIDIQLCFRVDYSPLCPVPELKNPLKLANAGSFGIPTIAWPELSYEDEFGNCFMPAYSLRDIFQWCSVLKEGAAYGIRSDFAYDCSKRYDISRITELYKQLEKKI